MSDNPDDEPRCPLCGWVHRPVSVVAGTGNLIATGYAPTIAVTERESVLPSLLLQALIIAEESTSQGQLIRAVTLPWVDLVGELVRQPSLAYQIPPRRWEEIVAGAYQRSGFEEVILTPRSGDLGRDIIAVKRGLGTIRIIDQVKAFSPGHLVTADDVRALLGVLVADGASKGFLTTTSDFAPRLREDILLKPWMPARLELVDGKRLMAQLRHLRDVAFNNPHASG